MKTAALLTARQGSKSVPNKNLYKHNDIPLYQWNVRYASECKLIDQIYISTDIQEIFVANANGEINVNMIKRPSKLCQDNSSHYETIMHGLNIIEKEMGEIDYLVILLGNAPFAYTADLKLALQLFEEDKDKFDSCQSVANFPMFNPFRSFNILTSTGELRPIIDNSLMRFLQNRKNANDKNAFGEIYFFTGGFWICKPSTLRKNDGDSVFSWLGKRIMPYIQPDGLQEIDAPFQLKLL
jgi:CMP-N-acetylneuraminic acid synthetase